MRKRIQILLLGLGIVASACQKIDFPLVQQEQIPIDLKRFYDWLGHDYDSIYEECREYVVSTSLDLTGLPGHPDDWVSSSFRIPNYSPNDPMIMDYIVEVQSEVTAPGQPRSVVRVQVAEVHENPEVFHPTVTDFLHRMGVIMDRRFGGATLATRMRYRYMMHGQTDTVVMESEVYPEEGLWKDVGYGKLTEMYKLRSAFADSLARWGGVEQVRWCECIMELYASPNMYGFLMRKPGTPYVLSNYVKKYQCPVAADPRAPGSLPVEGYQSTVFASTMGVLDSVNGQLLIMGELEP